MDSLIRATEERLKDTTTAPPEDQRVRTMSAITLGRLRAEKALPSLHIYCPDGEASINSVNNACGWAIERITGKAMRPPRPLRQAQREWFLTPHQ